MADAITVTLGEMGNRARQFIAEGQYATMSEVVRAGLRALEREEAVLTAYYEALLAEALADPRPGIPFDEAIKRIKLAVHRSE
jgi:antitoxin ParD1/3/4